MMTCNMKGNPLCEKETLTPYQKMRNNVSWSLIRENKGKGIFEA